MSAAPFADRASTLHHYGFALVTVRDFGVSPDEAPDAAQAVLLSAFLRRRDYKPGQGTIEGWLYGIARRIASNWRRTRERRPEAPWSPDLLDTIASEEASPEEAADRAEEVRLCAEAISPDHWRALVAFAVEGMTIEALAKQEGVSYGAMEWRLHVAQRELRAAILLWRKMSVEIRHERDCPCWRCVEVREGPDAFDPWRARDADPLTCPHPDDHREPTSGDFWTCGLCGDFVPEPDREVSMRAPRTERRPTRGSKREGP